MKRMGGMSTDDTQDGAQLMDVLWVTLSVAFWLFGAGLALGVDTWAWKPLGAVASPEINAPMMSA